MAEPDYKILFESLPGLYLVLDPSLRIVAASDGYLNATQTKRDDILGRCLFDAFPAPRDPDDARAQAVRDTRASLDRVLAHGVADSVMVLRHEVRRPESEGGGPVVRHWAQTNSPILNPDGSVAYIVHRLEDATGFIQPDSQVWANADPASQTPAAEGDIPVPRDVAAPHVLIVEDQPETNLFLARELGPHYWVSRAFSVDEAVRKALLPDQPDLILASVTMPGMNGDAMVDEIRRHAPLAEIPIMMLTTQADDALRLKLLRRGVHEYLQKPFPVEELLLRVQALLTERKRMERLRESEERYRTLFNSIDEGFCIVRMIFD